MVKKREYLLDADQLAVSITGAREGDVIVGSSTRASAAQGVRLEVASGVMNAWGGAKEMFSDDEIIAALAKTRRCSIARAEQLYDDIPKVQLYFACLTQFITSFLWVPW